MKIQQKLAFVILRWKINLIRLVNNRKAAEEAFRLFCTPIPTSNKIDKNLREDASPLLFSLNGQSIRGCSYHAPKQKKVLLLHGFSSRATNFNHFIEPLVQKGYEVLAFDAPAHGFSEGKMVNAVDYCEMILKVIKLYGPIDGFIAHSFGGIAISLAMETLPPHAGTKIVLIAPATETSSAIEGAFKMIGLKSKRLRSEFDQIVLEKSGKDVHWFSIRRAMNNIKASVLWIHDEEDDITPLGDALSVLEDQHPNIQFMITRGLGHRKIYRDGSVLDAIIKFL